MYFNSCIQSFKCDFIKLCVEDNASDIDKEVLENIFNPFFTIQEVGEETGFGLSKLNGHDA